MANKEDMASEVMKSMLSTASKTVVERCESYGRPYENHKRIADLWESYLDGSIHNRFGDDGSPHIGPHDVVIMMMLVKIARLENDPRSVDSWMDLAGYAAVGLSIVEEENTPL
tara:strand:+ start:617 stop:955 length:339 start_codon:yes stop_codon:yes gene_type:complete